MDTELIKYALQHRAKSHQNWGQAQHWYWRWFYTVKAIICIALNRIPAEEPMIPFAHEHVDSVAVWNFSSWLSDYGTVQDWQELEVGHGIWRNWHVHVIDNGT